MYCLTSVLTEMWEIIIGLFLIWWIFFRLPNCITPSAEIAPVDVPPVANLSSLVAGQVL